MSAKHIHYNIAQHGHGQFSHPTTSSPPHMNDSNDIVSVYNSHNGQSSNASNGNYNRSRSRSKPKPSKARSSSSKSNQHNPPNHTNNYRERDRASSTKYYSQSTTSTNSRNNNSNKASSSSSSLISSSSSSSSSSASSTAKEIHEIINDNIIAKKRDIEQLPNRKKLVMIAVGDENPLPSHAAFDFIHCKVGMERRVMWKHFDVMVLIVPHNTASKKKYTMFEACKKAKKMNPKLFVCIIDIEASESAVFRSKCFDYGANMVTNDHHSLKKVLNIIGNKGFNGRGHYSCPYCGMHNLTEDELWQHVPLYHVNHKYNDKESTIECPICDEDKKGKTFLLHLRNHHGPVLRGEVAPEYRDGILTHAFALVVVRRPSDSKFLVVQEASNSGFWLPGGRVEVGETLLEAATRETKEEAGIDVDIKGVLKVEHSTYSFDDRRSAYNRMRVIFYAEPMDETELPKSVPNYDSAGATFISVDELDHIELRAEEPREWFNALTKNFYYHSLNVLSCWKHDHRSPDHPGKYYYETDREPEPKKKKSGSNKNKNKSKNKNHPKNENVDGNVRFEFANSDPEEAVENGPKASGNEVDEELDDNAYRHRLNMQSIPRRRHTSHVPSSSHSQIEIAHVNEFRDSKPNHRDRGPSEPPSRERARRMMKPPEPPIRNDKSAPASAAAHNTLHVKNHRLRRSKTPQNLMSNDSNNSKSKNQERQSSVNSNVKASTSKNGDPNPVSPNPNDNKNKPKSKPKNANNANSNSNPSANNNNGNNNSNSNNDNKSSSTNTNPPNTNNNNAPQYQQVTYMMYQPFTPNIIPNMYYSAANMYQRQSMHLPPTQPRAQPLKKQISAEQASATPSLEQDHNSQQFYMQQLALQQAQIQAQYNAANMVHPFYVNQPLSPNQGRGSGVSLHNNNIIYHNGSGGAQPPHVNPIYPQPPLMYTPAPFNANNNAEMNPNDNIQITNLHNNQQPKLEIKSNKSNKKTKKNFVHQSDSLIRKKRNHRRSSSNTLPQRDTLATAIHHNTTPPPGIIYSDHLNSISAQRGIIGGSNNTNQSK